MSMEFLRKLASDELTDTLFFATGSRPTRTKTPKKWSLCAEQFVVDIINNRNIRVNGSKQCKSASEAKILIQQIVQNS